MFARLRALLSRTRTWLSPGHVDRDFEQELETHLEMLTEDNLRRGMAPEEAARAARLRLGGLTQLKDTNRELHGFPMIETFLQDTRYAFRMLRRNPAFTAVAVLTLALGIGANTAIFSVVYAVMLKPLPYASAEQLFNVFEVQPQQGVAGTGWSYPNFTALRERTSVFSEMAGVQQHQLTLTARGEPAIVNTSVVTPELFALFGAQPLAGRTLLPDDGKVGAPPVVVLSETLWRGSFGADPGMIGSFINLDKRPFTVIGIMPAAFRFPPSTESGQVWIPLVQDPLFASWMPRRAGHWLQVTGRLKPGVSMTQARAELDAIGAQLAKAFPAENEGVGHPHGAASADDRRRCEVSASRAGGRRRPRALDRVRQHRQPASCARDFSLARNRGSDDAGRRASPNCPPVAE
jgi:putative ABC transport system permease protein